MQPGEGATGPPPCRRPSLKVVSLPSLVDTLAPAVACHCAGAWPFPRRDAGGSGRSTAATARRPAPRGTPPPTVFSQHCLDSLSFRYSPLHLHLRMLLGVCAHGWQGAMPGMGRRRRSRAACCTDGLPREGAGGVPAAPREDDGQDSSGPEKKDPGVHRSAARSRRPIPEPFQGVYPDHNIRLYC